MSESPSPQHDHNDRHQDGFPDDEQHGELESGELENSELENDELDHELSDGNHGLKMFVSFLTVSIGFIFFFVMLVVCYMGLLALLAPPALELFGKPPEEFNQALAKDPSAIFPLKVTVSFCLAGTLIALLFGFLVAHLARFGRMAHGGVLALVIFVTLLQLGLSRPAAPQWFLLTCLLLFPLGIILGSFSRTRCCA